jgi:hypothetical protein
VTGPQGAVRAAVTPAPAKPQARWQGAALLTIVSSLPMALQAADTCYRDDTGRVTTRRLPGSVEVPCPSNKLTAPETPTNGAQRAAPETTPGQGAAAEAEQFDRGPQPAASPVPLPGLADYVESVPLPDRWRIVDALGYKSSLFDPYNRNPLKADTPFAGDWFYDVSLLSDSKYVYRDLVSAVDLASAERPGSNDVFGRPSGFELSETVATDLVLYKGDTVFKPPDWQIRVTPVVNYNYASVQESGLLNIDPRDGTTRSDEFLGLQNAFVEKRLRDVSDRFDFDSIRVGIQPFSSDFRGFLFQDNQLGVRLFGTRDNNIFQYNVAYFRRIEKDTNSGLNDLTQPLRHDDIALVNLYWQDMPVKGFTSQGTVVYNHNTEGDGEYYNKDGFLVRPAAIGLEMPHDYDVVYIGYNGDGHFGRMNATASLYYVTGHEEPGIFVPGRVDISAGFAALEISRDFDWARIRLSGLYATGDSNPYGHTATGFDAIFENPQFAGGDTSYWISQAVPLVGGGGVTLSSGNGVLADLRSSKDEGQSNFVNPGLILGGIGADLDVLPTLRVTFNLNSLFFANTEVIAALRNQAFDQQHIGEDASVAVTYRPLQSQNIVLRVAYARLFTANGFDALFPNMSPNYFLANVVLAY